MASFIDDDGRKDISAVLAGNGTSSVSIKDGTSSETETAKDGGWDAQQSSKPGLNLGAKIAIGVLGVLGAKIGVAALNAVARFLSGRS